jgi:ATP-dependent RNA helicase SUPV3L1/SUV3
MNNSNSSKLIPDTAWQPARDMVGDVIRRGAKPTDETLRDQVLARSYTLNAALATLGIRKTSLEEGIEQGLMNTFTDPEDQTRLTAHDVESTLRDLDKLEQLHAFERVFLDDLAVVFETDINGVRKRLKDLGITDPKPVWLDLRGKADLPLTLSEFRQAVYDKKNSKRNALREKTRQKRDRAKEAERQERDRRKALREQLLNVFPTWIHEGRNEQLISLHIGPPNSGKTHDALLALEEAGSGWYLAPLRLLAYEIFDRLNQRGTPCNLLTGEEYIPIAGATITAATIEMFNPHHSGELVIIDEAQMLADPDRGWAWTRALMEANSPDIHIIAPAYAQDLIQNLASSANIELEVIEHKRLAPIKIAERHFQLRDLQPKTLLIAFSRQNVLDLKMALEDMGRNVSIIYGALPPEVRRKQSDRFANGETEICVATDAVGMGLNLPADYVCFYELEKFDGRGVRFLNVTEVQQIGGRAGRFGYGEIGMVSTMSKRDLRLLNKLFYGEPRPLTHARIAPTVEDLALIPGTLAHQLIEWSELQSIPDKLRDKVKTADLSERIELAKMLTPKEVEYLGLAAAMKLINAPTNKNTRSYWRDCATSILTQFRMSLPLFPPTEINNSIDLEVTELAINKADIYLWLSHREEFASYAPEHVTVRALRNQWSIRIDDALVNKLRMERKCPQCGRHLPLGYRYRICENCYNGQFIEF